MIWEIPAHLRCPIESFDLHPEKVLNEFDGPKIFTTKNSQGHPLLAYWCGEDLESRIERFVLVPTTESLISRLEAGDITVYDALDQPMAWVVDKSFDNQVTNCWNIRFSQIPQVVLPNKSVFLCLEHQPYLTIRLAGPELHKDNVTASIIKRAVDSVTTTMKSIVEAAAARVASPGRPDDAFRMLYDLRAQNVAFASFQISFKPPQYSQSNQDVADDVVSLVEDSLEWLVGGDEVIPDDDNRERRVLALSSIVGLLPPKHGLVEEVYLSGALTGGRSFVLSRNHTMKAKAELKRVASEDPVIEIRGQVRQLDKDRCILTVRDHAEGIDQRCRYDEQYADDAIEALSNDDYVRVVGRQRKSGVVEISLLAIESAPTEAPPQG